MFSSVLKYLFPELLWLTAGFLPGNSFHPKGADSYFYKPFLRTTCMQCLIDMGIQKPDFSASIWAISEGPSYLHSTTCITDQLLLPILSLLLHSCCSWVESKLNLCIQISGSGSVSIYLKYVISQPYAQYWLCSA